jgi:hypothetical protein
VPSGGADASRLKARIREAQSFDDLAESYRQAT